MHPRLETRKGGGGVCVMDNTNYVCNYVVPQHKDPYKIIHFSQSLFKIIPSSQLNQLERTHTTYFRGLMMFYGVES